MIRKGHPPSLFRRCVVQTHHKAQSTELSIIPSIKILLCKVFFFKSNPFGFMFPIPSDFGTPFHQILDFFITPDKRRCKTAEANTISGISLASNSVPRRMKFCSSFALSPLPVGSLWLRERKSNVNGTNQQRRRNEG